jgi:hypothetical protein
VLVFPDMRVPVLVAMLRWMYRIPLHPGKDLLVELHDAGRAARASAGGCQIAYIWTILAGINRCF